MKRTLAFLALTSCAHAPTRVASCASGRAWALDGNPLPGVHVSSGAASTVTDASGRWRLCPVEPGAAVTFQAGAAELTVHADREDINVRETRESVFDPDFHAYVKGPQGLEKCPPFTCAK